jgi:hypothetical protein
MKKSDRDREVTISGYLRATEWDDEDNVVGMEIKTDGEGYVVEADSFWDDLMGMLDEEVEVTGVVEEEVDGTKRISVTNYDQPV